MKVLFIQTGGTIDKDYSNSGRTYAFEINQPAAKRILRKIKPSFEYRFIELLKKDSLDLTDEDRFLIYQACLDAEEDKVIITHGTDTMTQTAQSLAAIKNKTIVLTGSMSPERFTDSDASFNIGSAVAALPLVEPGIYIAMSGHVLPWHKIRKNYEAGQFVEIHS